LSLKRVYARLRRAMAKSGTVLPILHVRPRVSLRSTRATAPCARARWKIENETFNVLKNNGYHIDFASHNWHHLWYWRSEHSPAQPCGRAAQM